MVDQKNLIEITKKIVSREDVKYVIGYKKGTYGFQIIPTFAYTPEDAEEFVYSPLCSKNLAVYTILEEKLPLKRGEEEDKRKIGVVVKGCDSRAIVQIIQEKGLKREDLVLIGIPCKGVIEPKKIEKMLDHVAHLRVIAATQPRLASVSKKKPDIFEIAIGGGSIEDQFDYAKGLLGETINVSDVFDAGESIDVIGVTKGKGFQGPVKRWGVRILQHKSRKTKRGVASIGPWKPRRVMPGVPRAGQMGLHNRVEHNKRILLMGSDSERVNPKGGFKNYGEVRGDYVLLKGSVMGPSKRLIKLRKATRTSRYPAEAPQVTYLNTEFGRQAEDD